MCQTGMKESLLFHEQCFGRILLHFLEFPNVWGGDLAWAVLTWHSGSKRECPCHGLTSLPYVSQVGFHHYTLNQHMAESRTTQGCLFSCRHNRIKGDWTNTHGTDRLLCALGLVCILSPS